MKTSMRTATILGLGLLLCLFVISIPVTAWGNGMIMTTKSQQAYPVRIAVTTDKTGLNVRTGPGTSFAAEGKLPLGTVVEVLEERNGWLRIDDKYWICACLTKALDNKTQAWCYIPNKNHKVPDAPGKAPISKYGGCYVGDTSGKNIYLTFDLGYEAGYTPSILDTLKENDVKAAFFVVKTYIDKNPKLIQKMVDEGHIVGNHTYRHPSLPSKTKDISAFNKELTSTEDSYRKLIGKDMPKYMRPPMGEYSELSMYLTQRLGYKSIFWSFAYYDYDLKKQPDKAYALKKITAATHNGAILLLHGVSKTNTAILDALIKEINNQGYQFCSIDTL